MWKDYDEGIRSTLLRLLHAFELAYPARNKDGSFRDYSIVPAMLPNMEPLDLSTVEFGKASLTPGRAACIQVTLNHFPLHFFPRLHARLQAIVRPDDGRLWATGGLFREQGVDDAATMGHRVLVWQPNKWKSALEVGEGGACVGCQHGHD